MTDAELWLKFAEQEIPHADWNHQVHVRMGYLHVSRWSFDEAHLRLRAGIIRLNHRHGLEESASRGYFETLTRVWLLFVARAAARCQPTDSLDLLARCPELTDRQLPQRHYSKELLATPRARAIFVEPDLTPLPSLAPEPERDA